MDSTESEAPAHGPRRARVAPEEPGARHPVTLAEVAREAGTSASTASRALRGQGYVAEDVRERLLAAADRLGYVPNASAQSLKQRRSRVIGVVVSELANQFYARLAAGVEQELRAAGYQMLLVSDNSEEGAEMAAARTFLALRSPGVIMTAVGPKAPEFLNARGVVVVEVDRQQAPESCDAVVLDNVTGAHDATTHLLGLGHRRIAFIGVDTDWTSDAGRLAGYRLAHVEAGAPVDESLTLLLDPRATGSARGAIASLLEQARPTAMFTGNNILAVQAWQVVRDLELRLPTDISLVGFDDLAWMEMVTPGITVVSQPTHELGRQAALLCLRRLAQPSTERRVQLMRPQLVVRGSTGPPRS
ncbi:MAG: transcriptional regulator, LacI family [Acidimicrobiaceae bacterium]|nr:transcriptional regulator, LacI family [Acidimicrobiaceae bacterium]